MWNYFLASLALYISISLIGFHVDIETHYIVVPISIFSFPFILFKSEGRRERRKSEYHNIVCRLH
jgi:hypothetical protein